MDGGYRQRSCDRKRARDADLEAGLLDLDLAQARLVEELCEAANELLLAGRLLGLVIRRHARSFLPFRRLRRSCLVLTHDCPSPEYPPSPRGRVRSPRGPDRKSYPRRQVKRKNAGESFH